MATKKISYVRALAILQQNSVCKGLSFSAKALSAFPQLLPPCRPPFELTPHQKRTCSGHFYPTFKWSSQGSTSTDPHSLFPDHVTSTRCVWNKDSSANKKAGHLDSPHNLRIRKVLMQTIVMVMIYLCPSFSSLTLGLQQHLGWVVLCTEVSYRESKVCWWWWWLSCSALGPRSQDSSTSSPWFLLTRPWCCNSKWKSLCSLLQATNGRRDIHTNPTCNLVLLLPTRKKISLMTKSIQGGVGQLTLILLFISYYKEQRKAV